MVDYKTVQCSTCGQDWYKVRLIAISEGKQNVLNALQKSINIAQGISLLIIVLIALAAVGGASVAIPILIKEGDAHWKIASIADASAFLVFCLGLAWTIRHSGRKERMLQTKKREICASQGVEPDEKYEFVST